MAEKNAPLSPRSQLKQMLASAPTRSRTFPSASPLVVRAEPPTPLVLCHRPATEPRLDFDLDQFAVDLPQSAPSTLELDQQQPMVSAIKPKRAKIIEEEEDIDADEFYSKTCRESDQAILEKQRAKTFPSYFTPVPPRPRPTKPLPTPVAAPKPAPTPKPTPVAAPKPVAAIIQPKQEDITRSNNTTFIPRPWFGEDNCAAVHNSVEEIGDLVLDSKHKVHAKANRYLREYQRDGIKFMFQHQIQRTGCILNDDMGLGKTVQVIGLCLAMLNKQGNSLDGHRVKQRVRKRRAALAGNSMLEPNHDNRSDTILILCPKSVVNQWASELETWGFFDVEVLDHAGTCSMEKKINLLLACSQSEYAPEILLVNHHTLVGQYSPALLALQFQFIVLDECHVFKNLNTIQTKNCRQLQTRGGIVGLTGTIMQNNFSEYWTVMTTVDARSLVSWEEFNTFYAMPIKYARSSKASAEVFKQGQLRAAEVRRKNTRYILRRTKQLIKNQLPIKTENVVFCQLTALQRRCYERIAGGEDCTLLKRAKEECDCGRAKGNKRGQCCYVTAPHGPLWRSMHHSTEPCKRCPFCLQLPAVNKLILACNHLDLLRIVADADDDAAKRAFAEFAFGEDLQEIGGVYKSTMFTEMSSSELSGKLTVLSQLMRVWRTVPATRVLVFSHYTRVLDILQKFMDRNAWPHMRLDGGMSADRRTQTVNEFNDSSNALSFCLLVSTKAGGTGLNLTAANIVVLFDSSWNPSYELQAQDRAYRLGQRRDVEVYRLLSTGTIEDRVYCRQLYKLQMSSDTLEGNVEERYFHGVMGDPAQQGELFGIHNLVDFNPNGHLAELKSRFGWQVNVKPPTSRAAKAVVLQQQQQSMYVIERIGFVEQDLPLVEELLFGDDDEEQQPKQNKLRSCRQRRGLVESLEELESGYPPTESEAEEYDDDDAITEDEDDGSKREIESILNQQVMTVNARSLLNNLK